MFGYGLGFGRAEFGFGKVGKRTGKAGHGCGFGRAGYGLGSGLGSVWIVYPTLF